MSDETFDVTQRVYASFESDFWIMANDAVKKVSPRCESPIERMLAAAFLIVNRVLGSKVFAIIGTDGLPPEDAIIHVYPQYEWEGYRIDFYLETKILKQRVFVECDGHAYHERTAEQAERDRRKDRLAQEQGIAILRFTGRELHRSPADCAQQIMTFLNNRAKPLRGDGQ